MVLSSYWVLLLVDEIDCSGGVIEFVFGMISVLMLCIVFCNCFCAMCW